MLCVTVKLTDQRFWKWFRTVCAVFLHTFRNPSSGFLKTFPCSWVVILECSGRSKSLHFNKTQKWTGNFGITDQKKKALILGNSSKVHTGTPIAFHLTMYPSAWFQIHLKVKRNHIKPQNLKTGKINYK